MSITKFHKWCSLNNRNLLSHNSGNLKSKVKMLAGLIPSDGYEDESFHVSLLASGAVLVIFGIPCFIGASPQSLPSCSYGILLGCACLFQCQISLFLQTQ